MVGSRPWFIGDDVTDEDGFRTAKAAGGGGILVGPWRETAATYALPDVASVRAWLAEAIAGAA
jgi:trehalose 6-phosphate phosphatase